MRELETQVAFLATDKELGAFILVYSLVLYCISEN